MNKALKSYKAKCKKIGKPELSLFHQVEDVESDYKSSLSSPRRLRLEPKAPPKKQTENLRKGNVSFAKSPQPQTSPHSASPQPPPTCSLFDKFQMQNEDNVKTNKVQIKRCSNHGSCDYYRNWVTIFGYPKEFEGLVICFFDGISHIVDKYIHQTGNWMHLCFKSKLDCRNVLQYNHRAILPHKLYVGIVMGAPDEIMKLLDPKRKQNAKPESPQPQRVVKPNGQQTQSIDPEHICPECPQPQRDGPKSPQPQNNERLYNTEVNPIIQKTIWQRALDILDL